MTRENISDKYGDLFIHFANANNADEAIKVFFYDAQKAFDLSINFPQKAQKLFPGIDKKELKFTVREKEYLDLIEKRNNISDLINNITEGTDFRFYYYDDEFDNAFIFTKYEMVDDHQEETKLTIEPKDIEVGVSNFGISDDQKYIMINYLNALLKIENGITNNPLSNEKRKNIIELLAKQKCKTELRNHIESVQKKTQLLLTTIQESDDFYNTNIFKSVMVRYNSLLQSKIIVSKRYGLKTVTLPFGGKPMEELLLEKIKDTHGQYQNALRATYLSECVCYCFLEYLRQPGNYSGQRIKKCPYCNHYFIAKDSKRKRCYLESCSKEYEKEKKRKQRNDEPEFYA